MPVDPKSEDVKAALKEGLREWLDEQFAAFGRWAAISLLALFFSGVVYLAIWTGGWRK